MPRGRVSAQGVSAWGMSAPGGGCLPRRGKATRLIYDDAGNEMVAFC